MHCTMAVTALQATGNVPDQAVLPLLQFTETAPGHEALLIRSSGDKYMSDINFSSRKGSFVFTCAVEMWCFTYKHPYIHFHISYVELSQAHDVLERSGSGLNRHPFTRALPK